MAAIEYDGGYADWDESDSYDFEDDAPRGAGMARFATVSGTLVSLGLAVGLGIWGYNLLMRDVNGVPVVRNMDGAVRVAPADPGGLIDADQQGLAVNAVAADQAARPVAHVNLAPQTPGLSAEDMSPAQAAEAGMAPMLDAQDAYGLAYDGRPAQSASTVNFEVAQGDAPALETTSAVDDSGLGFAIAPAPRARPEAVRVASASAVITNDVSPAQVAPAPEREAEAPAAEVEAPAAVATASPAPGAKLAQLGAFDSEAVARSEWQRLSAKYGGAMSGKAPVIQKAVVNGRTYWRLRVSGFDGTSAAKSFCGTVTAGGGACIPVTN